MNEPKSVMATALSQALRAKTASVPEANPVRARRGMKAMRGSSDGTGKNKTEPDSDQKGGASDMDADNTIRNTLKKAMK